VGLLVRGQLKPAVVPEIASLRYFAPGERCTDAQAGDLIVVHHYHSFLASAIRFGEWLRPRTRPYSYWNHCALFISPDQIVQEVARGAIVSGVASLDAASYAVVSPKVTKVCRAAATQFALWSVGTGYGFATIGGDALNDLTGFHLSIGVGGRMVCSGMAARAWERLGLTPDIDPTCVQPADMARWCDIKAPQIPTV
jgi:uncharacterized protein YycO